MILLHIMTMKGANCTLLYIGLEVDDSDDDPTVNFEVIKLADGTVNVKTQMKRVT